MRVKEDASAEDHEEYREPMSFEVDQRNDPVGPEGSIEWLQNSTLKVITRDWIEAATGFSSKSSMLNTCKTHSQAALA